ncbi:MAG: leucyl/phenylalanyl-tRNA--protein transferase [Candidatus Aminicenantes bacterium]|nr:leucyl/phenylalanyl-tRNA--protein transferase [Candidatus Aminicenantes bacterium]
MTVYLLGKEPVFPPADEADPIGIIAVGGDLSPERLIAAYSKGIFPWYSEGEPILWWSPDPRLVLFPDEIHISGSLRRLLNRNPFEITFDRSFDAIIEACQQPRKYQGETWITEEMITAYKRLHELGYAHSLEVRRNDEIVGGLYGVSLGRCFFAESMFHRVDNASKFGMVRFVQKLNELDFRIMDCQVSSSHLKTMGAREIPRKEFLDLLTESGQKENLKGSWSFLDDHK